MALPCGHRAIDLPQPVRAQRVKAGRCPICPDPGQAAGVTRRLWRQAGTCRACQLSAGACGCCEYHWTVSEGQACQVMAAEHHATAPQTPTGPGGAPGAC